MMSSYIFSSTGNNASNITHHVIDHSSTSKVTHSGDLASISPKTEYFVRILTHTNSVYCVRKLVLDNHINLSELVGSLYKSSTARFWMQAAGAVACAQILCYLLSRHKTNVGSPPLPAKYIDEGSDFKRQADQLNLEVMAPFSPLLKHLTSISTQLNGIWFFRCITHNTEGPLHTAFRSSFKNVFSPLLLEIYNRDGKAIVHQHIATLVKQLESGQTLDLKKTCVDLFRKLTCLWFASSSDGALEKSDIESALFVHLFADDALPVASQNDETCLTTSQKATVQKLAQALLSLPEISIEAAQIKNSVGGGALLDIFHGFSIQSLMGVTAGFMSAPIGFGPLWRALNTVEGPANMQNFGFRLALLGNVLGLKTETQSAAFSGFRALMQLTDALRLTNKQLPNSLIRQLNESVKKNMPQLPTLLGNTFAPSADEITLYTSVLMVMASTFLTPVALTEFLISAHQHSALQREISTWRQSNPTEKASIQVMTNMDVLLGYNIPFNALSRIDETGKPILVKLTPNPTMENHGHGFAQGGAHECMGRPLVGAMFADIMHELFTQAENKNLTLNFTPETDSLHPISAHDKNEPAIFQWREISLSATQSVKPS